MGTFDHGGTLRLRSVWTCWNHTTTFTLWPFARHKEWGGFHDFHAESWTTGKKRSQWWHSHSNKLLALYPDMVLLASMDLNAGFLIENIQSKQTKHWFPMTIHYHTLKKPTKTTTFHYVRWLRWLPSLHSPPAPAPAPPPAPKRVQVCRWMGSTASVVGWTNPGSDLTWEAKPWAAWAAWAVQWRHKVEHLGENMWT